MQISPLMHACVPTHPQSINQRWRACTAAFASWTRLARYTRRTTVVKVASSATCSQGFLTAAELENIPELSINPLAKRISHLYEGGNFKVRRVG